MQSTANPAIFIILRRLLANKSQRKKNIPLVSSTKIPHYLEEIKGEIKCFML